LDAPSYIYQPLPPPRHKSFEKIEALIILRAPPCSRAWLVRLDLEGGKQAWLGFSILSSPWFGIIFVPFSILYHYYFYMLVTIVITISVFILFMFFVIMFMVYFDYMLSIVGLSLCSYISSYSAHSKDP